MTILRRASSRLYYTQSPPLDVKSNDLLFGPGGQIIEDISSDSQNPKTTTSQLNSVVTPTATSTLATDSYDVTNASSSSEISISTQNSMTWSEVAQMQQTSASIISTRISSNFASDTLSAEPYVAPPFVQTTVSVSAQTEITAQVANMPTAAAIVNPTRLVPTVTLLPTLSSAADPLSFLDPTSLISALSSTTLVIPAVPTITVTATSVSLSISTVTSFPSSIQGEGTIAAATQFQTGEPKNSIASSDHGAGVYIGVVFGSIAGVGFIAAFIVWFLKTRTSRDKLGRNSVLWPWGENDFFLGQPGVNERGHNLEHGLNYDYDRRGLQGRDSIFWNKQQEAFTNAPQHHLESLHYSHSNHSLPPVYLPYHDPRAASPLPVPHPLDSMHQPLTPPQFPFPIYRPSGIYLGTPPVTSHQSPRSSPLATSSMPPSQEHAKVAPSIVLSHPTVRLRHTFNQSVPDLAPNLGGKLKVTNYIPGDSGLGYESSRLGASVSELGSENTDEKEDMIHGVPPQRDSNVSVSLGHNNAPSPPGIPNNQATEPVGDQKESWTSSFRSSITRAIQVVTTGKTPVPDLPSSTLAPNNHLTAAPQARQRGKLSGLFRTASFSTQPGAPNQKDKSDQATASPSKGEWSTVNNWMTSRDVGDTSPQDYKGTDDDTPSLNHTEFEKITLTPTPISDTEPPLLRSSASSMTSRSIYSGTSSMERSSTNPPQLPHIPSFLDGNHSDSEDADLTSDATSTPESPLRSVPMETPNSSSSESSSYSEMSILKRLSHSDCDSESESDSIKSLLNEQEKSAQIALRDRLERAREIDRALSDSA
ncbi:hypothetical protein ABKN59_010145 [Abortiporus biennis]